MAQSTFLEGVLELGYLPSLYARALARTRAGQVAWCHVAEQLARMVELAWRRDVAQRAAGSNVGVMCRKIRDCWPQIQDTDAVPERPMLRLLGFVELVLEDLVETCDAELREHRLPRVTGDPVPDVVWPVPLMTREEPDGR